MVSTTAPLSGVLFIPQSSAAVSPDPYHGRPDEITDRHSGGNTINLTVNGKTTKYAIPSSFNAYHMYFKAGSYNQSSSSSTTKGARVAFYALTVKHS